MNRDRSAVARFAINAAPLLAAHLVANAFLLVNAIAMARILGPDGFGLLAIAMAVYGIAAFVSDAGLGIWGLRTIAEEPDPWKAISRLTISRVLTAAVALAGVAIALQMIPLPPGAVVPSMTMALTMFPAGFSAEWALVGLERNAEAAVARIVIAALILASSPVLAELYGPTGAAVAYVGSTAVGAVLCWVFLIRRIGRPVFRRVGGVANLLRTSFPMGLNAIVGQVYWQSDSLITGVSLGSVAAGHYGAPMRLLSSVVGVGWIIGTSLLPVYRSGGTGSTRQISAIASTVTRSLALVVLPAVGIAVAGADQIVRTILGDPFVPGTPVFAIGTITLALWICAVPTGYSILAMRSDRKFLVSTIVSALVSIPAMSILTPLYGITGTAMGMLLGMSIGIAILIQGAASLGVRLRDVSPYVAAAGVGAVAAYLLGAATRPDFLGLLALTGAIELPFIAIAIKTALGPDDRVTRGLS